MPEQGTIRNILIEFGHAWDIFATEGEREVSIALAAIKEIRKAEVPEKMKFVNGASKSEIAFYNHCRQEVLRRIEENE